MSTAPTATELDVLEVFREAKTTGRALNVLAYTSLSIGYLRMISARLAENGLIERVKKGPFCLTEKGEKLLEKKRPQRTTKERRRPVGSVSGTDLDILVVFRTAKRKKEPQRIREHVGFSEDYINMCLRGLVYRGFLERTDNGLGLTPEGWAVLNRLRPEPPEEPMVEDKPFGGKYPAMTTEY